jgi:isoleucyl-tRNA synthetase
MAVTTAMDDYDAKSAGDAIESFVDQLSNWYVRRNRRRFWKSTDPEDKHVAYLTLYECLTGVTELMAPFLPFLAENVYQNLVRSVNPDAPESIHMSSWPEADPAWKNDELLFKIDVVQKVVGLGRAARGQSGVRTRQPLSRLLVRAPSEEARAALEQNQDQVLEELNVKAIEFIARDASHVTYRIKVNTPSLGRRGLGPKIPAIRKWLEGEADGADIARAVAQGEPYPLPMLDEPLPADDFLVETEASEGFACAEEGGYLVELDTALSEALIDEGVAREVVRSVQDARKQAGLEVADRIVLGVSGSAGVEKALATYRDYVMNETLATGWETGQSAALFSIDRELGAEKWTVEFRKA